MKLIGHVDMMTPPPEQRTWPGGHEVWLDHYGAAGEWDVIAISGKGTDYRYVLNVSPAGLIKVAALMIGRQMLRFAVSTWRSVRRLKG